MVVPKKYLEEKGDDYFVDHPIGSGPYKLSEWKEKVHIKLEAQDSHWRVGVPKYKYLTLKGMPEEGTRVAALKSGEVDVIKIGLASMEDLKSKGFVIKSKKEGILVTLKKLYTDDDSPIEKLEVREALNLAIDRKAILDKILLGQGRLEGAPLPMFTWSPEYKPYPSVRYDPKRAKELLAKAGYSDGFTIYLYSYVTVLPEVKIINEAIAGYWVEG
jgi:peptide/nickel transport system substrate-binding protein